MRLPDVGIEQAVELCISSSDALQLTIQAQDKDTVREAFINLILRDIENGHSRFKELTN
jgi:hypothetical protein